MHCDRGDKFRIAKVFRLDGFANALLAPIPDSIDCQFAILARQYICASEFAAISCRRITSVGSGSNCYTSCRLHVRLIFMATISKFLL